MTRIQNAQILRKLIATIDWIKLIFKKNSLVKKINVFFFFIFLLVIKEITDLLLQHVN